MYMYSNTLARGSGSINGWRRSAENLYYWNLICVLRSKKIKGVESIAQHGNLQQNLKLIILIYKPEYLLLIFDNYKENCF